MFNKCLSKKIDILKLHNLKFSTYFIKDNIQNLTWNKNSSYYIYNFNVKSTILLNNNELLNLIDNQIYKKINNKNIIYDARNVVSKLEWNKSLNSTDINNLIELMSGKNDIDIQYLRRDWKNIIQNNAQLKLLLIKKFNIEFWNLLNDFYNLYSFNSYLNIDNVNGDYYFDENINIINNEYDLENKISEFDEEYLKKYFIYFSNNNVFFNINKSSKFSITLAKFNKIFKDIKNQDDWFKYISDNSFSMKNINDILNKVYSFNNEFNLINEIILLPNSSITSYYKNILTYNLTSENDLNLLYTFLVFIMIVALAPFVTFRAIEGEI